MPLYEIQGPDGKLYEIEGPAGASKEQIVAAIQAKLAETPAPKEGVGAAFVGGAKRFGSALQTTGESFFDPVGAAKRGVQRQEAIGQEYAPGADWEKVKQAYSERGLFPAVGEAISQVPAALAEQGVNIGATLGSARLGAMAGAPLGPVGSLVGGGIGATIPSLAQLFGSNIERQAQEGADISRGRAAAAAVPGAALEVAATYVPLGRSLVGKILGPEAEKALAKGSTEATERLARESIYKAVTKGAGLGVLAEVPTEVIQQMLERAQAGLPLTDEEAQAEYGQAAYGAALVGTPFGALGRTGQRYVARGKEEERVSEERRLQEELAAAEQAQAAEAEAARKFSPDYRLDLVGKITAAEDRLKQVEPVAKDKTVDEDVRKEAIAEANELKKQLKELNAAMKESMKGAGLAPTLQQEIAARPRETPVVDEFGNIVKPKKAPMSEEEYGMGLEKAVPKWNETRERIEALREEEAAEADAKREAYSEEVTKSINQYLLSLDDLEDFNMQEKIKQGAAQQQRREEDVAQEMTLDRINLVLENFGLRAAGVTPEVRKVVEDKVNEGVVDRTVTKVLGIEGLEGRTYRGDAAQQTLPNIQESIKKLSEQRNKLATNKQELMDAKGQLTPAGYKLVAIEAKLNELNRLTTAITSRTLPETGAEQAVQGLLGFASKEGEAPAAVDIEPNKPVGLYKRKAEEGRKNAGGSFTDIVAFMDDYRQGRFFGEGASPEQRKLASYTRDDLINEAEESRKNVVDGLIQEIAYERQAQGLRPLSRDEAIGAAIRIDEALKEIITRSTALPRGAALTDVVIEPAQMRGTEIVKEARTARIDPRPLAERQFGNPRRAIEVLTEVIKQTRDEAVQAGKRPVRAEKPLLKKQYETAPTDLVKDLDRVLRMENLQPDVRNTLDQVQRRFEEGGVSAELEELVEEQVGRILRGTDRPFTLERDVTKPGGRRAMAAAGKAQLIDDIQNQLRVDSQTRQYAEGEQRTVVPRGEGFAEVDVQPSLFPETEATARATPAQFQRLQKSGKVRKEQARIAEEKKKAKEAEGKLKPLVARIKRVEEMIEQLQPVYAPNLKFIKERVAKLEKNIGKRREFDVLKKVLTERYDTINDRLKALDALISEKIPESEVELRKEFKEYSKILKPLLAQSKKETALRKELEALKERRTVVIRQAAAKRPYVEAAPKKEEKYVPSPARAKQAKESLAREKALDEQVKRKKTLEQARAGLGLPGMRMERVQVPGASIVRKKTKVEYEAEMRDYKESTKGLPTEAKKAIPKPTKNEVKPIFRKKLVPIKSKVELDEELAEQKREQLDDLKRRARATSPEAVYKKLEEQEKVAVEAARAKTNALNAFVKAVNEGRAAKNFPKFKRMSAEVDAARENVNSIRQNRRLLEATQYNPEKAKRQPARATTKGEIPLYDKKFTPDQLRKMSGMGLSAFDGNKTYSVDDSIDFAIGDKEGGGINLEEANKRIDAVEKKLPDGVKFKYFPTMKDVTVDILKDMSRQGVDIYETRIRGGVKPDGTVFVIGENHNDMLDLEKTIVHEFAGHYTFEGLLGENGMRNLLKQVEKSFGDVYKLADTLGVKEDAIAAYVQAKKFGTTDADANLKALREVVAHTMERRVDKDFLATAKRWLQEMVGAVRAALRKMGLMDASNLSTSDLFYMMRQAHNAFLEGKPVAYRKSNGDIDYALTGKPKYAAGFEDVGNIADKLVGRQEGKWNNIKANVTGLAARVQFVDRWAALEALVNKGVTKGIIDSLKAQDVMYFARMADQRHSIVAETATNGPPKLKEMRRPDGRMERIIESERGASLREVSEALLDAKVGDAKATGNLFTLYLAAERAQNVGIEKLNFSGKITKADLDKALALGRSNAAFQKARNLYNQYNRGLVEFAVQAGAISKERGAAMLKNNDYIPYYRMRSGTVEMIIGSENPIRIGDVKNQPYLQELVGGDEAIMDFFTSSLQNTTLLTDMALRNLATRNAAFALADLGVAERAGGKGIGIRKGNGPANPNTIRFKLDGEDHHIVLNTEAKQDIFGDIPPDLIVKGMEGIQIIVPGVVRALAAPANWLRKFVTRDPRYAVRQIFRDSMAAALTTGSNAKPLVDTMGEIAKMYSKGGSEAFKKLQSRGVLGGQVITGAPEDMSKIMQQITAGKPGWDLAMAKLDQWAQSGDAGTRVAMYNSFLRQGLSEREATLAALESMNFGRRGVSPSVYFLNATIPFFNAGVQGLDVLYRAMTGRMPYEQQLKVKKKFLMRGGMMAALTMAYAAMMQDDEAYKEANPEQRYGNWFVRIPGFDEPFRVPIPFEVGLLFKAVPEGIYNAMFTSEKGSKVAKDLSMQLMRSLPGNPAETGVPVPTAIKPFIETALNKSFFTGRDIVDSRMDNLDKQFQYRDKTPELLKILGPALEQVNLSPVQVENFIRSYTGAMGIGIMSVADFAIKPAGPAGDIDKRVSEMPIVGGLFQPNDAGRTINEAYEAIKDIQRKQGSYKALIAEGKIEEAQEYVKENINYIGLASYAGSFRQKMGEITKAEKAIKAAPASSMTPEEKRQRLDQLREVKRQMAETFKTVRDRIELQAAR